MYGRNALCVILSSSYFRNSCFEANKYAGSILETRMSRFCILLLSFKFLIILHFKLSICIN